MMNTNMLAAQMLLYNRPLYKYIGKDEVDMNVLVLGWNEFSERFVDQCLQAGQMNSHFLNITVLLSDTEAGREQYLSKRPALSQFVNVNGSLNNKDIEMYAALNFIEFDIDGLTNVGEDDAADIIMDVLAEAPDEKYHYFIISVDQGQQNREIAGILKEVTDEFMPSDICTIHYLENDQGDGSDIDGVQAIRTESLAAGEGIDSELERMAYNAHLVWDDAINGDAIAELKRFREDEYNYQASVELALSVKYKLADLGIYSENHDIAAAEFWDALQKDENQEMVNRIIALEHRRWVLNMVCQKWTAPKPEERLKYYDDCIERRSVKNISDRIHPCIVRSTTATPLSTGVYANDKTAWDIKNAERDGILDELDLMSVELHRKMQQRANAYRKSNPMENGVIADLRNWLHANKNEKICREWERFVFCIKNILDGSWAYSKQFDKYRDRFEASIVHEDENRDYVKSQLNHISDDLWPVIEANMYRDYKKYDEVLVKRIPFILTYNIHLSLAMAFRTSSSLNMMNDNVFRNVASATVIKPEKLTYLLFLEDDARRDIIRQMIQMVRKYMTEKGINCQLNFLITGQSSAHVNKYQKWKKCFDRLQENGSIFGYQFKLVDSDQEAVDFWIGELAKSKIDLFDGTTNLFQSMYANSALLQVLQTRYPYFEFDGRSKTFKKNHDCRFLSYIEDHTYLGIEEMFGLLGAEDMEFNYPVLGNEYLNLWNIYIGRNRGNKKRWKDNVRYAVKCWNVMCDTLENFSELYPGKEVISLDELQQSYRGYQRWNDILNIIRELAGENGGKQYLIPEKEEGKMMAFRYSNADIKSVLTKAGDLLEIYTYFRVCEKGYFDDVACGYRFRWEEEKVNNELDLVLTKGFQSLIVECKARSKLDQNFYFKLNSLVDMFGVGAHKVLLTTANTEDNDDNRMQRERGNMMGITTISEIDEIQDIAETLMALLQ